MPLAQPNWGPPKRDKMFSKNIRVPQNKPQASAVVNAIHRDVDVDVVAVGDVSMGEGLSFQDNDQEMDVDGEEGVESICER